MSSYACTKDGVEAKNARKAETSMLVSLQYADHMKTEIKKRIDDLYNAKGKVTYENIGTIWVYSIEEK